jgi:hypothetical protein
MVAKVNEIFPIISRVKWLNISDASGTIPVPIIRPTSWFVVGDRDDPENVATFNQLTRPIAREDFINFNTM